MSRQALALIVDTKVDGLQGADIGDNRSLDAGSRDTNFTFFAM